MQKPYYRGMRAQWLNAFSAGFERDSRPRSMSAGADSDGHWVCDAHDLTWRLFESMVRRLAGLPLPTGEGAAAEKQTGRRKEGDGEVYEKSLEMRHFRVFRARGRQSWRLRGPPESLRMNKRNKGLPRRQLDV